MNKKTLVFSLIGTTLLFISDLGICSDKGNRDKYNNYVSNRYNILVGTQFKLAGLFLYTTGTRGTGPYDYVPKKNPFPEDEATRGAQIREKYTPRIKVVGDKLHKINEVILSLTTKWTPEHLKALKDLVNEINAVWMDYGFEMTRTFPPTTFMAKEPPISEFLRNFRDYKVKTVVQIDQEK